jgi:hypothetical protein
MDIHVILLDEDYAFSLENEAWFKFINDSHENCVTWASHLSGRENNI